MRRVACKKLSLSGFRGIDEMTRVLSCTLICFIAAVTTIGCAENPADKVPTAETSQAKPTTVTQSIAPTAPTTVTPATKPNDGLAASSASLPIAPETSKLEFEGSKVTGSHKGGFKTFKGFAELAPDGTSPSKISIEIDMDSTYSDNDKLTGHLKAPDFFDVTKFPKSAFETTEIKTGGEKGATHTVTGNLTLHGVTKSITFPATIAVKDGGMTLTSEFSIKRKDFGITYTGMTNDLIRDEVVIRLDVKAPKKA